MNEIHSDLVGGWVVAWADYPACDDWVFGAVDHRPPTAAEGAPVWEPAVGVLAPVPVQCGACGQMITPTVVWEELADGDDPGEVVERLVARVRELEAERVGELRERALRHLRAEVEDVVEAVRDGVVDVGELPEAQFAGPGVVGLDGEGRVSAWLFDPVDETEVLEVVVLV